MTRPSKPLDAAVPVSTHDSSHGDDRGLADLPNALSAISLSSDKLTTNHSDELGLVQDDAAKSPTPRRERVGM